MSTPTLHERAIELLTQLRSDPTVERTSPAAGLAHLTGHDADEIEALVNFITVNAVSNAERHNASTLVWSLPLLGAILTKLDPEPPLRPMADAEAAHFREAASQFRAEGQSLRAAIGDALIDIAQASDTPPTRVGWLAQQTGESAAEIEDLIEHCRINAALHPEGEGGAFNSAFLWGFLLARMTSKP